jgi:hypothetical protein
MIYLVYILWRLLVLCVYIITDLVHLLLFLEPQHKYECYVDSDGFIRKTTWKQRGIHKNYKTPYHALLRSINIK